MVFGVEIAQLHPAQELTEREKAVAIRIAQTEVLSHIQLSVLTTVALLQILLQAQFPAL